MMNYWKLAEPELGKALNMLEPDHSMLHNIYGSMALAHHRLENYKEAIKYYELYLKVGKPGTAGYAFVEESIAYIKQEKFMEEK